MPWKTPGGCLTDLLEPTLTAASAALCEVFHSQRKKERRVMHREEPDDLSEDYGYDLAHEVPSGPDQRHPHPVYQQLRQTAPGPTDISTDYSSDEAHDL